MSEDSTPFRENLPQLEHHATGDGGREVVLVKQGQRYVFRCARGAEATLFAQARDMARDPNIDLTSFDAALICHHLGQILRGELESHSRRTA